MRGRRGERAGHRLHMGQRREGADHLGDGGPVCPIGDRRRGVEDHIGRVARLGREAGQQNVGGLLRGGVACREFVFKAGSDHLGQHGHPDQEQDPGHEHGAASVVAASSQAPQRRRGRNTLGRVAPRLDVQRHANQLSEHVLFTIDELYHRIHQW